MPGIQLAPDRNQALRCHGQLLQLREQLSVELALEEAHLIALGVGGHLRQRVAPDDGRQLVARAREHLDLQIQGARDRAPAACGDLVRRLLGGQHHVSTLQVGLHLLETGAPEHLAQLWHRDAVSRTEVDAAQQDDVPHLRGAR